MYRFYSKQLVLLFILAGLFSSHLFSQDVRFASSFVSDTYIVDLHQDATGSIYTLENHSWWGDATNSFDSVWVVKKYQANGAVDWAINVSSSSPFTLFSAFNKNKLLVAGHFRETLHYPGGKLVSQGSEDHYFLEIDSNGHCTAVSEGTTGNERITGFVALSSGELYLVGVVRGKYSFASITGDNDTVFSGFIEKRQSIFVPSWAKVLKTKDGSEFRELQTNDKHLYFFSAGHVMWNNTMQDDYNYVMVDLNGNYLNKFVVPKHAGEDNDLSIIDDQSSLFFLRATGKYPGDYFIRSMNNNGSNNWSTQCETSVYYGNALSLIDNTIFWHSSDFIWGVNKLSGQFTTKQNLNLRTYIVFGKIVRYLDKQFLFYGRFHDSISFGTRSLKSKSKIGSFVSIIDGSSITGENEPEKVSILSVYPNPVSEVLTLECDEAMIELKMSDQWGSEMYAVTSHTKKIEIPVEKFTPGIYFLEVKTPSFRRMRKIVVQQ